MMRRLVAVVVATHQAFLGDVLGVLEELGRQLHHKQGVEVVDELRIAAHSFDEAFHILGHIEGIHPRVAFHEALAFGVHQAKRLLPAAVAHPRTGKSQRSVEGVAPVGGTLLVFGGHLLVTRFRSRLIDGPIVVGIFQGNRDTSAVTVERHVTQALVIHQVHVIGTGGTLPHGFQHLTILVYYTF